MQPILLLVDDEPSALHALAHCLKGLGELRVATSGAQALEVARRAPPTLVLLDANMPGMDGFTTCKAFQADPQLSQIPIIFVTSENEAAHEVAGLQAGAVDYLSKPVHPIIVRARVLTQLRMQEMAEALRRLALEDPLTGLANRRRFEPQLQTAIALSARSGLPLSLIMVDIDHFKRFNDSAGHAAGDEALKAVSAALERSARRPGDLVGRLGGEEFAILMPQTGADDAISVAERVLALVSELNLPHPGLAPPQRISVSVGLSTWAPGAPTHDPLQAAVLMDAADQALYAAKHLGRNRACALPPGPGASPAVLVAHGRPTSFE